MRVVVFNEHLHEREPGVPRDLYPDGIHAAIAARLHERLPSAEVEVVTLADVESLTPDRLAEADALVWWGHLAHDRIPAAVTDAVVAAVLGGLGLLVLHSAAESHVFRRLMGTTCSFRWREGDDTELVWVTDPSHPIAAGLPPVLDLGPHEMYGEFFDIPRPDAVVFTSWFSGGEVFRSGCTFTRGDGRVFYFSPGHETFPVYHAPLVGDVLANAVRWLARTTPAGEARRFWESEAGWFRELPACDNGGGGDGGSPP